MTELNRSARDSTASATSAWECPTMPAASFALASSVLAIIPRKVARRLRWRRSLGTAPVLSNLGRTEERSWAAPMPGSSICLAVTVHSELNRIGPATSENNAFNQPLERRPTGEQLLSSHEAGTDRNRCRHNQRRYG